LRRCADFLKALIGFKSFVREGDYYA